MLLKRESNPLDWVSRQIGVFVKGKNPLNQISAAGNSQGAIARDVYHDNVREKWEWWR